MSLTHLLKWRPQKFAHVLFQVAVSDILLEFNLTPNETTAMAIQVPSDKWVALGIRYLDQFANPLLSAVRPDSPPTWSLSSPLGELAIASDNLSAIFKPKEPGSVNIHLNLVISGRSYVAETTIEVVVPQIPQEITKVEIATEIVEPSVEPNPPPSPPPG